MTLGRAEEGERPASKVTRMATGAALSAFSEPEPERSEPGAAMDRNLATVTFGDRGQCRRRAGCTVLARA